jgi:hypothetical protein
MSAKKIDKDGVKMLFKTKTNGGLEYYLSDADDINEGKFITTDNNDAQKKAQDNITFWRVLAKDVHYNDGSTGKTVRVNINAGGGLDKDQKNIWKDNPEYIWAKNDSKNAEFTYYIRCSGKISGHGTAANHVACSSKFRGGIHTGKHDPHASCCELVLRVGEGNDSLAYNFEYDHRDYLNDGDGTKKLKADNDTEIAKWFGRKTIVWTNIDGKSVTARDYIDLDPFDANGKPKNNWEPLQEKTYTTVNKKTEDGKKYNVPPIWGGMFTSRVDGFQIVDYAIVSIREIIPPTS